MQRNLHSHPLTFHFPKFFWTCLITLCITVASVSNNSVTANSQTQANYRFMVSAAHELAVNAGLEILDRNGSAVDAAVAVQAALSLVEPQSSGIGGGAFML